jgi:hypothetical protein
MSNASNCRATAVHYSRLAKRAKSPEARRVYERLARLWFEMEQQAERFDRQRDGSAKERIYELSEEVQAELRKVA